MKAVSNKSPWVRLKASTRAGFCHYSFCIYIFSAGAAAQKRLTANLRNVIKSRMILETLKGHDVSLQQHLP